MGTSELAHISDWKKYEANERTTDTMAMRIAKSDYRRAWRTPGRHWGSVAGLGKGLRRGLRGAVADRFGAAVGSGRRSSRGGWPARPAAENLDPEPLDALLAKETTINVPYPIRRISRTTT